MKLVCRIECGYNHARSYQLKKSSSYGFSSDTLCHRFAFIHSGDQYECTDAC